MTLFDRWGRLRPDTHPDTPDVPLRDWTPSPGSDRYPHRPTVPQPPAEDLLACEQCRHHAPDLTAAVRHARAHARAWADEARLAEKARQELAARYRIVMEDVRVRLAELERPV